MSRPATVRDQLLARADDDGPGLLADGVRLTWREAVAEAARWSHALRPLLPAGAPPHIGFLLANRPDVLHLLGAAGLGGLVAVGLNPTRRGAALARDVERCDVAVVLTDAEHRPLLDALPPEVTVIDVDDPVWRTTVAQAASTPPEIEVSPGDLAMLVFTSGTSGDPKAVRVTHAKIAVPGEFLGERFGLGHGDVAYVSMPLFHSNAVMAGWAPALATGAGVAVARFSASRFLDDVRTFGATYANYVGKPLSYVLATPARDDDADNPLRSVFGNEADEQAIEQFARRFACAVVDSYSSTENAVVVRREADMPRGALGRPAPGVEVWDPDTGRPVPDAVLESGTGRLLNPAEAIGELVNTTGAGAFAGYYRDPAAEAERMRGGVYWSGDLAYRDADGWIHFAGRSAEWMRVDGENLAAAPIERTLLRLEGVSLASVYAVPDPGEPEHGIAGVGDAVVAALVLDPAVMPEHLEAFLTDTGELAPRAWPRWVRVLRGAEELPRTATTKVLKRDLRELGVVPGSGGLWERDPRGTRYRAVPI